MLQESLQVSGYERRVQFSDPVLDPIVDRCIAELSTELVIKYGVVNYGNIGLEPSFLFHNISHSLRVMMATVASAVFINEYNQQHGESLTFTPEQISLLELIYGHDIDQTNGSISENDFKFRRNTDINRLTNPEIVGSNEVRSFKKVRDAYRWHRQKLNMDIDESGEEFLYRAFLATYAEYDVETRNVIQPLVDPNDPLQVIVALADLGNTYNNKEDNEKDVSRLLLEESPLILRYAVDPSSLNGKDEMQIRDQILAYYDFQISFVLGRKIFIESILQNSSSNTIKALINSRYNNIDLVAKNLSDVRDRLYSMPLDQILEELKSMAEI